ncbi:hypothetical protein LJD22_18560 [Bacillus velezensis]|nr:hypothetical protein [Bacillus velezensis]
MKRRYICRKGFLIEDALSAVVVVGVRAKATLQRSRLGARAARSSARQLKSR